jgi:hypothetical protein
VSLLTPQICRDDYPCGSSRTATGSVVDPDPIFRRVLDPDNKKLRIRILLVKSFGSSFTLSQCQRF